MASHQSTKLRHADFLQKLNQQTAQKIAPRKKARPLTAEGHATLCQQIDKVNLITPGYANTTTANISSILGKVAAVLLLHQ